jgi:hypothetical protein
LWELCPFELKNFPKFTTEAACQRDSSETTEQKILFSSFRGVALKNCDGQTDRTKTICLPTKMGGDIMHIQALSLEKTVKEYVRFKLLKRNIARKFNELFTISWIYLN